MNEVSLLTPKILQRTVSSATKKISIIKAVSIVHIKWTSVTEIAFPVIKLGTKSQNS